MQVGYLRPHNRHPRYANLYFVGASTHPGTGVPIVLLSAKLVTERILKEMPVSQTIVSFSPAMSGV
jgi:phytoene dehydrogenase-like protein